MEKKEYSREEYDRLEKDAMEKDRDHEEKTARVDKDNSGKIVWGEGDPFTEIKSGDTDRFFQFLAGPEARSARNVLNSYYEQGKSEAAALEAEYEGLLANAEKDLHLIRKFEKEKLGMHQEEAEGNQ